MQEKEIPFSNYPVQYLFLSYFRSTGKTMPRKGGQTSADPADCCADPRGWNVPRHGGNVSATGCTGAGGQRDRPDGGYCCVRFRGITWWVWNDAKNTAQNTAQNTAKNTAKIVEKCQHDLIGMCGLNFQKKNQPKFGQSHGSLKQETRANFSPNGSGRDCGGDERKSADMS